MWSRCAAKLPCEGHCDANAACSLLVDRCVPLSQPLPHCDAGALRVLSNDAELLHEHCAEKAQQSECRAWPPVPEGDYGTPQVALMAGKTLAVVAYDETYGDVVLAEHDATPPFVRRHLATLSGAPDGPIVGAPSGPRGGVLEAGADRGSALDAVADAIGTLHIVFADRTANELRYLRRTTDGKLQEHAIAQGKGLGTAVAMARTPSGFPVVLAFLPIEGDKPSKLLLYSAKVALPTQAADWQVKLLDAETPPPPQPPPCQNKCKANEQCAQLDKVTQCVIPQADCVTCLPAQVCHNKLCVALVLPPPPLAVLPQGRGAWLDMAIAANGELLAAAYSPGMGNLQLYRGPLNGAIVSTAVLPAALPKKSKDFGRFVSVIEGTLGQLWAAFEDSQHGTVLLLRNDGVKLQVELIDGGTRADGQHRVGADVALARHPAGGALLAYQDTRRADLWTAHQSKSLAPPVLQALETANAAGFSAQVTQLGNKAWVVSATSLRIEPSGRVRRSVVLREFVWAGE